MIDSEKLDELRAKHGALYSVDTEHGPVVYRGCNRIEFRQWKANRDDDAKKLVADEILARACVVYPDAAAFDSVLDKLPALATLLQSEIIEVSGGAKLAAKKL